MHLLRPERSVVRLMRPECHFLRLVRPKDGGNRVGARILSLHPVRCVPRHAWDEKYIFRVAVAFCSKNFSPAELNYHIYAKEMVVIVHCICEWRHMLVGCPYMVGVYTDYKNLEYF